MARNESLKKIAQQAASPCYLVDLALLRRNCEILRSVKQRTGCKILLALKAFAMWSVFDTVNKYLDGTTGSSINECKLGKEHFGGETHICCPAYREDEIDEIVTLVDHVMFNSLAQMELFSEKILSADRKIEIGLRINPMHAEVEVDLYNPCGPGSRLGVRPDQMPDELLPYIKGLHFHTLCEKNSDSLERTLKAVEKHFSKYFGKLDWVNFGGGHHISRPDYDVDLLCRLVTDFKNRYGTQVYLEPGEAIALNAGYLIAEVLDIISGDIPIAILDTSAAAHMPDVIEMPYRPNVQGSGKSREKKYTYRLTGRTCLAGDVISEYSFDEPLRVGDRLIFDDMAHYTMVKNTTFNGLNLPDIVIYDSDTGKFEVQKSFGYADFKNRLS
ncbi:MAG: carboxynorspermidine decarboxylase [Phycisphaerae bacterium]|jgi:carboxynorspermidine decarboxylase